jgi:hypothetical protein
MLRATHWAIFGLTISCSWLPANAQGQTWRAIEVMEAPEAHQAAAADAEFVYAITNDRIAKYDRRTRQRVAVSTGPAKHLNSGYFWNEKLFCAHSNYPQKPERSEVMVLDPSTMLLSVYKEFGNYGGSLTWVVRHDGHWWCNFARYGDQNQSTFVVKFGDNWQEAGRWTYPGQVLKEIGRNSLSGGLWRDGALLVTGHDDPELFRLNLPTKGTVLEFISTESIPFTGQGFADDPVTGGLVGIHRSKRQILFAAKANTPP